MKSFLELGGSLSEQISHAKVEEREFVLSCVKRWLDIKNQSKYPNRVTTSADVDHSSLLQRLLSKERIYKIAPPRSYSYPNTVLADGEPYYPGWEVIFVTEDHPMYKFYQSPKVVISQSAYDIIGHEYDDLHDHWILEWPETKARYILYKDSNPPDTGTRIYGKDEHGKHWVLQQQEKPEYL